MSKGTRAFTIDDASPESPPLTDEEKTAVKRAEADVSAGRLSDHDDVSTWLRQRAIEIVKRASKRAKSR